MAIIKINITQIYYNYLNFYWPQWKPKKHLHQQKGYTGKQVHGKENKNLQIHTYINEGMEFIISNNLLKS
jgi:hypothetical protein